MKSNNLKYQTESNFYFEKLKKSAETEKYLDINKDIFSKMEERLQININSDMNMHKNEIKLFLENEIISRKHFQEGRIEASLKKDPYIIISNQVLNDLDNYNKTLGY